MNKISIIKQIISLPKKTIEFIDDGETIEILQLYKYFNKRHPKYKIFKNKTIGVMLLEIPKDLESYEKMISGKNGVGYFSRRCTRFGYYTKYFIQKEHLDELFDINSSSQIRQGRKMADSYMKKLEPEQEYKSIRYYGVFSDKDILVGYIRLIMTPKVIIISRILGHDAYLKDNIMYLLFHDLIVNLITEFKNNEYEQYLMYDTIFGASEGLKLFKKRNCLIPYKVKWKYVKG